ncbi:MAG: radical SAM family heme chaperone HemW [Paraprevotella sp.]|nr:radical SAM family heme chaperone HemW [Paraprevotella sp.]
MAGIYLHIPFCSTRCIYCDFYSTTWREKSIAYIQALINEIQWRASYLETEGRLPSIETVYIGGGTPSLLKTNLLQDLFDAILRTYPIAENAEITLETNPDDLSGQKILELKQWPINRLSMGIQTFDNEKLRLLHRRHCGEQAIEAVRACQEAGFDNISIDLIYGLPGQTLHEWEKDIAQATSLHVQNLSAYALIYEEHTRLWEMRSKHLVEEANDELSLNMFDLLIDRLQSAGFEHYEISTFALPGFRSRHNTSYWKGIPYLGCGPSAHSFDGKNRQWNLPDLNLYINKVGKCRRSEDFIHASWIRKEELTIQEQYNECIITALRTSEGLDLHKLRLRFGDKLYAYCLQSAAPYIKRRLLEISHKKEQTAEGLLHLTRQGLFLSDGIMSDLLYVED